MTRIDEELRQSREAYQRHAEAHERHAEMFEDTRELIREMTLRMQRHSDTVIASRNAHTEAVLTEFLEPRDDGSLVLRDPHNERRHRLRAARGAFRDQGQSVSDLLAERRTEAAREDARRQTV